MDVQTMGPIEVVDFTDDNHRTIAREARRIMATGKTIEQTAASLLQSGWFVVFLLDIVPRVIPAQIVPATSEGRAILARGLVLAAVVDLIEACLSANPTVTL